MRHAVILAGGSGTRLWPMSREALPKQLLPFIEGRSLLELAFERLEGLVSGENTLICTGAKHLEVIRRRLPGLPEGTLLGEPEGRDTLVALATSCAVLEKRDPGAVVAVLTADHLIRPADTFRSVIARGYELIEANPGVLGTFGIAPDHAATGFGYLELGDALPAAGAARRVNRFVEKPDRPTAERYFAEGPSHYLWNSGMFVWKASRFLECVKTWKPAVHEGVTAIAAAWGTPAFAGTMARIYPSLEKISVDYAVMEPASKENLVVTVPMALEWHDIGSWTAYAGILPKDTAGNASAGRSLMPDSSGNLVVSDDPDHLVCLLGCSDLVVIRTADATLVCPRDRVQDIKKANGEAVSRFGDLYR